MNTQYRKSLSEVLAVINSLETEQSAKISNSFIEFVKDNMDLEYYNTISEIVDENFVNTMLSEDAKGLIALVYRDYLVDKDKREELLKEETEIERKYQEELREKYNPDNIFKRKQQENEEIIEEGTEETALVEYKEQNFIQKILNIIIQFLKK